MLDPQHIRDNLNAVKANGKNCNVEVYHRAHQSQEFTMFQRVAVLLVLLLLPAVCRAQTQRFFKAIHNATEAQYSTWVNSLSKDNMHQTHVSVGGSGANLRFAGIADNSFNGGWFSNHDLTSDAYQKEFTTRSAEGFRLMSIAGYTKDKDNTPRFAAVWVQNGDTSPWVAHHNQTDAEYQASFDANGKKGLRPIYVTGYRVGKSHRLASIFADDNYGALQARHGLTGEAYQKVFTELSAKGFRSICSNGYPTASGVRFALIMVQDKSVASIARHGLTPAEYQKLFESSTNKGFTLTDVSGYQDGNEVRYACVYTKHNKVNWPLPTTGTAVPSLSAFDDAMQKFMRERHIQCGTLAVTHNGKLVLSRGYGYVDREANTLCGPATPMRIASIVKPITLAALLKLIRENVGKLTANTKVVSYLNITPPKGQTMDKRWNDITVQHLIDHQGGFVRKTAAIRDPMFKSLEISKALGKTGPATPDDIIRYMAGQPLQFTPGNAGKISGEDRYSNFGYCILGRVIEKASGKKYMDYVRSDITLPLAAPSIDLGRTLKNARNPKEPVYIDPGFGQNVFAPNSKVLVPQPDGAWYAEAMDAHGGMISSAPDLTKFLNAYSIGGQPRKAGDAGSGSFFGGLPGTHTLVVQRNDGVNYAALFNQRTDPSGLDYNDIRKMLDDVSAGIKAWPK